MTGFDYAVLGILLASLGIGAWRGLVGEVLSLLAWIVAAAAAWSVGPVVAQTLYAGVHDQVLRLVAGYATVAFGVIAAVALFKLALRGVLSALGLSFVDRLLGVVFGLLRGLAIVLVLVLIGGLTSAPKQEWWREASLAPPLETAVLAGRPWLPPELAKRIRFR